MSRTRSAARNPKPATVAANIGVRRRSLRLSGSKTKGSDEGLAGSPGARKNANKASKPSTRAAMATPTCPPRRSQRLVQSIVKSSYHFPPGYGENAQNTPETTTATVLRRSQRLLQSKTGSSKSCFFGAGENAQNSSNTTTTTVLRTSQRLLQSKTGSFKSRFLDGNTKQACDLFKKSSVRQSKKSILPVNIEAVRLNFDDVGTVKCNNPILKNGGSSERRITRNLSSSVAAQKGQKMSGSRTVVQQRKDSIPLSSLSLDIGKIIGKDDDNAMESESDSSHVSKLEKRCRRTSKGKKVVGAKRKKKQSDEVVEGSDSGWTKEQENALQRAYFAAKPTPNFWKRVARLVPGKSSQECFDKVNSENLTPLVPQPRSRCKQKSSSPQLEISFTESDLLPEKSKKRTRRKNHINQKTVRNIMRKNSHISPDNKADFFSVLEPTLKLPSTPVFSTPIASEEKGSSSTLRNHFLSSQKKSKSRFSNKSEIPIASPPVLKPVKNIALHDKYVDLLHAREAKRKTISKACSKRSNLLKLDLKNNDVIRAAKESLISDANDVITKFRRSEMNIENGNDSEEDFIDEEDEDEDGL